MAANASLSIASLTFPNVILVIVVVAVVLHSRKIVKSSRAATTTFFLTSNLVSKKLAADFSVFPIKVHHQREFTGFRRNIAVASKNLIGK